MTEQCSNCKFYTADETQVAAFGNSNLPGICRKNPPLAVSSPTFAKSIFPACRPDTWCGAWQE